MPSTLVLFYREADGSVPLLGRLNDLRKQDTKVFARFTALIDALEDHGRDLGPPNAKLLRDGIYELRARFNQINHRILYFFSGSNEVTLSHDFVKAGAKVPDKEIELAIARKKLVALDHKKHTYKETDGDAD